MFRIMPRSPRLAHKAPFMQAKITSIFIRYLAANNPGGLRTSSDWGRKLKSKKISWASKPPPPPKKKSLDQNLTPKKSHAEFPSLKTFEKILNGIARKKKQEKLNLCVCFHHTI